MIKKISAICFLAGVSASHAFAAGSAHGDTAPHGGAHHEASSGLPQLDPSSFLSQGFWMIAVFTLMYIFFARKSLPDIAKTVETRAERIKNDLISAERLKEEVASVQESYELSLKKARDDSAALFRKIEDDIKIRSEKNAADANDNAIKKIDALEKNITKARKKAMDEMSQIAAEIATEAAEKIIGIRADDESALAVVKSLNKAA